MICLGFVQNQVTGRAGRSRVIREAGAYLKIPENFSPPDGRKWHWSSNPILVAVSARARAVAMVRQRGLSEGEECPMPIQEAVGASPPHTSPIPGPQSVREVLGLLAEEAQGDGSAGRGGSEAACWACPAEGASGLHPVVGEVEGRLEESGQGPQEGVQSGAEEAGGGVGTLGKGVTVGRGRATSAAAPAGRVCGWGPRL